MGNVGRVICVALPFALTLASLIALLVAGLAGVADKSLYMFQVNTTGLSISKLSLSKLVHSRDVQFHDTSLLNGLPGGSGSSSEPNITAADLGLYNLYDVGVWGYCYTPNNGGRECTKPEFNWAEHALNASKTNVQTIITTSGQNVALPKEITDGMTAFGTVARWTEIVFIIAYVCLGVELFFGIFANCSRAWSCVTWLVAGIAATAVCAAATLATVMAATVVGTVEATAKLYGVKASFNTRFLATVWIAAAFALASGFFWIFTICCCKPEHRQKRHHGDGSEKLIPTGAYAPLHEPENRGFYNTHNAPQYGAPRYPSGGRSDLAYEPYSHSHH